MNILRGEAGGIILDLDMKKGNYYKFLIVGGGFDFDIFQNHKIIRTPLTDGDLG